MAEIVPGSSLNVTGICSQQVSFSPGGSMHKYGFDGYKEALPPGSYPVINVGDEQLHLPWKSVATGGSDRLFASPLTDSLLSFAYEGGMPLSATTDGDGWQLWTLNPPGEEDNLLALCQADSSGNAWVAGGVRVKSYPLQRQRLVLVPVGSSQASFTKAQLQTDLNAIYAQAVSEWEVSIDAALPHTGIDDLSQGITVGETDYSEHMRQVWRALVMDRNPVPGATYLFIIPGFKDHPAMTGYMPLKSGYGFLAPQANTRDAAHELGHGAFNLRHTFSNDNVVVLPEGSTQNLMDYPSTGSGQVGSELWKYQWDYIHNPEGGWFVWEDMEEGAGLSWLLGTYSLQSVTFSGGTNNFFTVVSDNGDYYDAPHHEKILTGSRNKPVAFLKGTKMIVSAQIKLREKFSDDKELIVRLRMNDYIDSAETHTFIIPSENISITKTTFYQEINITDFEIDVTLPNHVYFKEHFEITFEAAIKDKSIDIGDIEDEWWTLVGKTKNDLYVLFGRPHEVGTLFESVLFMTCRNLQVQASVNDETLLAGIWSLFNTSVVENRELAIKKGDSNSKDHIPLKYYNPHNTQVTNAKMLLKSDGNGQCGSFASLFIEMLLAHGYPYNEIKYVYIGLNKRPYGFLVKNWTFSNTGTSKKIDNIIFTHTNFDLNYGVNSHNFSITEVSDAPGIPGQNSPNPASMFNNHQIVGIGKGENKVYYDPSYGKKYESELEIKNSIDGVYCCLSDDSSNEVKYNFYIKKREAMDVLEIEIEPTTYYERLKLY